LEKQAMDKGWSPYVAGALTGLVMILSVWFAGAIFRPCHGSRRLF
jgi:hypothetical protein